MNKPHNAEAIARTARDIIRDVIVEQANQSAPLSAILSSLGGLPNATANGLTVRIKSTALRLGALEQLRAEVSSLESVAELRLKSAPVVVELIAFGEGEGEGLLICDYDHYRGETLVGVNPREGKLSALAGKCFRAEMEQLLGAGLIHPYARGLAHLMLTSETKMLVIDDWDALRKANSGEGEQLLESLDTALAWANAEPNPV